MSTRLGAAAGAALTLSVLWAGAAGLGCDPKPSPPEAPRGEGAPRGYDGDALGYTKDNGANGDAPTVLLEQIVPVGRSASTDGGVGYSWSGAGFVVRFSGTGLNATLINEGPFVFRTEVDGVLGPPIAARSGSHSYRLAEGLPEGEHELALLRQTEGWPGKTELTRLEAVEGVLLAPPPRPERRIEVVGDSISTGYGDLGEDQHCGYSYATQSHWHSYGAVAARMVEAELSTVAVSGRGMFQNLDGTTSGVVPDYYNNALTRGGVGAWVWSPPPDAVIINLGTNDFSSVGLGHPDPTFGFAAAYAAFVAYLRDLYPRAFIVCTLGPMLSDTYPAGVKALSKARDAISTVVRNRQQGGDERVVFLEFPVQGAEDYGCDYHPNVGKHASMGEALAEVLREKLGW